MDLRARLAACRRRWDLQVQARLDGGHRSDVFTGTTADGTDVIVKLSQTRSDAILEAAALRVWEGSGAAVRLLDADLEHGAR